MKHEPLSTLDLELQRLGWLVGHNHRLNRAVQAGDWAAFDAAMRDFRENSREPVSAKNATGSN